MKQAQSLPKVRRGEIAAGLRALVGDQVERYTLGEDLHHESIEVIREAQAELDRMLGQAVGNLRRKGTSWAEVGELTGLTPQGAQQRWRAYAPIERKRVSKGDQDAK